MTLTKAPHSLVPTFPDPPTHEGPSLEGHRHPPPPAAASVVVPCFNQLVFTQKCVATLFQHTRASWELIAVDNGSTDGTADYLAGIRDTARIRVEVVTNAENRGFPAACNQGIKAARGELLSCSTTTRWSLSGCRTVLAGGAGRVPRR